METETKPQSNLQKATKIVMAGVLAVGMSLPISMTPLLQKATNTPTTAYADGYAGAVTVHKDGFDAVPAQDITLGTLDVRNAVFLTTNDDIKFGEIESSVPFDTQTMMGLYVDKVVATKTTIPGEALLFWSNCGTDKDGDAIDVKITISQITLSPAYGLGATQTSPSALLGNAITNGNYSTNLDAHSQGVHPDSLSKDSTGQSFVVSLDLYKAGTDIPAEGKYLFGIKDIDTIDCTTTPPTWGGEFSESLTLLSGYSKDVYLTKDTMLVQDTNSISPRFYGSATDNSTYLSGFVTTFDSTGSSFRWSGSACGSALFRQFSPSNIVASHDTGSTITSEGTTVVPWKNDKTYTIAAQPHYRVTDVLVDGKSVGVVNSYSFNDVISDHTIEVKSEEIKWTVTFKDPFQTTPISEQLIPDGDPATAPTAPEHDGYEFKGWDKSFDEVTGDLVVTGIYDAITNDITASTGKGGSITDEGLKTYEWKTDGIYTITPDEHYKIKDVLVDGVSVGAVDTYTFNDVVADHTIEAQFEPIEWNVIFDNGKGVPISEQVVFDGDPAVAPADPTLEGYKFIGWDKSYDSVTGDLTISAKWEPIVLNVDASHEGNGGITEEGTKTYDWDSEGTYTITPDAHYKIKDVLVDGVSVGAVDTYTFTNLEADHTIKAIFEPIEWTVIFNNGDGVQLSEEVVLDGDNAIAPQEPTLEGYKFIGWDKTYNNITGDLVVTAQWEKLPDAPEQATTPQQVVSNISKTVKTGDLTAVLPLLALLCTSVGAAMVAWVRKRKVEEE